MEWIGVGQQRRHASKLVVFGKEGKYCWIVELWGDR